MRVPGASFPCQHLLLSVFIFSHSGRCVRVSILILICISLMTNVLSIISWVYLPSMYLWGATVPVQIFCPLWGITYFITIEFWESFLYSGYNSLSDMRYADSFCPSVACLHFLNGVYQRAEVLNFNEVQFIHFPFYGYFFPHKVLR